MPVHSPDDVEISKPRLDHRHVGGSGDNERHLAQGFRAVGGIHLISPLVAVQHRGGAHCVAERSP